MRENTVNGTTIHLTGLPRSATWIGMERIQIVILLLICAINITVVSIVTALYFNRQKQTKKGTCRVPLRKGDSLTDINVALDNV